MSVVADTTPLRYLVAIGAEHVLPGIFGVIVVPPEVLNIELQGRKTPEAVKRWAQSPPPWLVVRAPSQIDPTLPVRLHRGEIEAISLAQELEAEWLLMDDWDARRAGAERGFKLAGTLAILEEAAVRGLVDIAEAVAALQATNFYATGDQFRVTLENVRTRRAAQDQGSESEGGA